MGTQPPGQITRRHQAMATDFSITVAHPDVAYAGQAVAAAFDELDRLESRLSAFEPQSDVSRIAALGAGEQCVVDPETFDCLRIALEVECATGGAFDIGYRARPHGGAATLIELDARTPVVRVRDRGVLLDLGGIGKGYALDRLAALLADWDLHCVLLRASKSTVVACQPPPGDTGWTIRFGTAEDPRSVALAAAAMSGSGSDVKGLHIIDPHTGQPARHHRLAFAVAPTGAEADALSTAFVVMADDAIRQFCANRPGIAAYAVQADQTVVEDLRATQTSAATSSTRSTFNLCGGQP
jgi:FAD:protein FMN transferase